MTWARLRARLGVLTGSLLLLVAASSCGDPEGPAAVAPQSGAATTVEYAPGLSEDLYLPDGTGRVPLVVLVPGGSWTTADPTGLAGLAAGLADAGVAAAPTHLRAAQDGVVYPTPVEDVLCALAAAVKEARSHGFRPDPVVLLGHSSGAHLAALAVLAYADFSPSCSAPLVEPAALIGLSGPYDIARVPEIAAPLMGTGPDDDPATWRAANPVRRAGLRPDVPVLLRHGEADDVVPLDFTSEFADALRGAGHPTTVQVVPGADHQSIYSAAVSAGPIATWLHARSHDS